MANSASAKPEDGVVGRCFLGVLFIPTVCMINPFWGMSPGFFRAERFRDELRVVSLVDEKAPGEPVGSSARPSATRDRRPIVVPGPTELHDGRAVARLDAIVDRSADRDEGQTFITSSPRRLMTLAAMRPDGGLSNAHEVSLWSVVSSISASSALAGGPRSLNSERRRL